VCHQKQGLPGVGREVFGGGDVKTILQNNNLKSEQRTKNKKQRTKIIINQSELAPYLVRDQCNLNEFKKIR
jgi:hypothetical protein